MPVGAGDFDVEFGYSAQSADEELMFAGIGLVNASNGIELLVGFLDQSSAPGTNGGGAVIVRRTGDDERAFGGPVSPVSISRRAGQVVISGFNTVSLWRLRQAFTFGPRASPWDSKFIGLLRLRDWLRVLGFELNGGKLGCYAPPFQQKLWLDRFAFMEQAGARWWPIAGGLYVVRAVKRTHGMRLITPKWRQERARRRALAPIPQKSHKNRD